MLLGVKSKSEYLLGSEGDRIRLPHGCLITSSSAATSSSFDDDEVVVGCGCFSGCGCLLFIVSYGY